MLYYASFAVDCVDGKIARLREERSVVGSWLDFVLDRIRVVLCTLALFAGQFLATGREVFLFAALVVVFLSLFGYVNGAEIDKARRLMDAHGAAAPAPGRHRGEVALPAAVAGVRDALHRRRIRMNLVSGIEFEMAVLVVAPLVAALTGPYAVVWVTVAAAAPLVLFELSLIARFWLATRGS